MLLQILILELYFIIQRHTQEGPVCFKHDFDNKIILTKALIQNMDTKYLHILRTIDYFQ